MAFVPLAYSRNILRSWPLWKTWCHHFFVLRPFYLKGLAILPNSFLERESWSQLYQMVFDCPLAWSCPEVFNSGLGMRLYKGRFDKELFSCRIFGISKLFQAQKSFWHRFKANSSEEIQVIPMERFSEVMKTYFCFDFLVKNIKWHLVGHKRFKFQFEGYWEPFSKHSFYLHE